MAQWESQTRKMNRHYQSSGMREGPLWSPPDWWYIQIGEYFDDNGGNLNIDGSAYYQNLGLSLFGNYYDQQGTWYWEDDYHSDFTIPMRVTSITTGQRTFSVSDYNGPHTHTLSTTIVKIPLTVATSTAESLFDGTTTTPSYTPWIDALTHIVIEYCQYPYQRADGVIMEVKNWCHLEGNTSPYPYVNSSLNFEITN